MRLRVGSWSGSVTVLTLALVLLSGVGLSAAPMRADVEQLLDEGISLFDQGQLDDARAKFEKAMLLDPTSEEAMKWVEKVGYARLVSVLEEKNDALSAVVGQILRLTYIETRNRSADGDAVNAVLDQYFATTDILESVKVLHTGVSKHGVYLVPGCVERLAVAEQETRVQAIEMLYKIKDDAVLPLCRVLHHDDPTVVQGAIHVLRLINNPEAIPSLRAVEQTSSDSVVKSRAAEAIRALDPDGRWAGDAYNLLLAQAKRFYMNSSHMNLTYHDPVVWSLEGGNLTHKKVHRWALNELRADQFIADAMEMDPNGLNANVLQACNAVARFAEYEATVEVVERTGADESVKSELAAEKTDMVRVRTQCDRLPMNVLLGALDAAMNDRRPQVAMGVMESLREQAKFSGRVSDVPAELLKAQDYDHRGVRFSAAECIAYMNPTSSFMGAQTTIDNLTDGLVEAGARVALTVFPDQDDALHVRGLLNHAHVVSFNETDGFKGLHRAINFPPEDVIVLADGIGGEMSTVEIITRLRKDPRTKSIPVLVVAKADQLTNAQNTYAGAENVTVINRSIESSRLRDEVLAGLFEGDTSSRARSISIAARAADVFSFLADRDHMFDLRTAEEGLVKVLENRTDSVRIPACIAVAHLGVARAESYLVAICQEGAAGTASTDLYEAALKALGGINRNKATLSTPVEDALQQANASSEAKIIKAAARVWGGTGKVQPAVMNEN